MAFAKRPVIRTTSQVFKIFAWNESKMVSKSTHGSQAIFYSILIWYFWNHFQNRPSSSSLRTWRRPLTELVKDWRWTCTCTARAARLLFLTNHIIDLWCFPRRRRFLNFPFSFRVVTGDSHWTLSEAYANHSTNPSLPPSLFYNNSTDINIFSYFLDPSFIPAYSSRYSLGARLIKPLLLVGVHTMPPQ